MPIIPGLALEFLKYSVTDILPSGIEKLHGNSKSRQRNLIWCRIPVKTVQSTYITKNDFDLAGP